MKKSKILISSISKDIGIKLPINKYLDDSRMVNYNVDTNGNINLNASYKKHGDKVYNIWYNNNSFKFYGVKDFTIHEIYINNYCFIITIIKDKNGKSFIKKIKFLVSNKKKSLSIKYKDLDNPSNNEYVYIDNDGNKLSLTTNSGVHAVSTPDDEKVKFILRTLLEVEESDIKESFGIINSSIPNFFDNIKYDYKVLEKFNKLYVNNKLCTENIIDNLMYTKTKIN